MQNLLTPQEPTTILPRTCILLLVFAARSKQGLRLRAPAGVFQEELLQFFSFVKRSI
jgi:hypothetical protein